MSPTSYQAAPPRIKFRSRRTLPHRTRIVKGVLGSGTPGIEKLGPRCNSAARGHLSSGRASTRRRPGAPPVMPYSAPSQSPPAAPTAADRPPCGCSEADRETFLSWVGRLVHRHRARLVAVARREGLGSEDAFDVVQEAFQTFLSRPAARALVDAEEDSRRSLITITRNVARNRRRLAAVARPHRSQDSVLASLPEESASVEDLLAAAEDEVR